MSYLDDIAPLFDAYRQFYNEEADLPGAKAYLQARLERNEAIVFLATPDGGSPAGFTLLYPTFCSVAAQQVLVLYDLFVDPAMRRQGIATNLLETAAAYADELKVAWLKLETEATNQPAQSLYEKLGWKRDTEFFTYYLKPSL